MIQRLLFTLIAIGCMYCANGQVTINSNNTLTPPAYVGWDNTMTIPLDIKTEDKYPINFYTFSGPGTYNNLRMFIQGNNGYTGIGNFGTANTLLHLHQSDEHGNVDFQMTDVTTGSGTTDGFEMEYYRNGYFHMTQNEYVPFDIYSQGTDGFNYKRLRIWADDTIGYQKTRVGIMTAANFGTSGSGWDNAFGVPWTGPKVMPLAMLHIGDGGTYDNVSGGYRTWMDYGTYVQGGSDNVYFGLKNEDPTAPPATVITDFGDAVVGWGDNLIDVTTGPDNINDLRFIFTASNAGTPMGVNPKALDYHGLEVTRMSASGNVGIGNFFDYLPVTMRPARRLEVLDNGLNLPQFRLTYNQAGVSTPTPAFTDFKSTINGDLLINPIAGLSGRQRVGINLSTTSSTRPQAVLEIGQATTAIAQLRLTQATNIQTDFQTTAAGNLFIHPANAAGDGRVGINKSTPGNTLEIKSDPTNLGSGLRFSDLTSGSTPGTANGLVLTVDPSGDVILVPDGGSGGICSGAASDYLMRYDGTATPCTSVVHQNPSSNYVSIGTTAPTAQLESSLSNSSSSSYAGKFNVYNSTTTANTYAIALRAETTSDALSTLDNYIVGVSAVAIAKNNNQNVMGGSFIANGNGQWHYGIRGSAEGSTINNIGVEGLAVNSTTPNQNTGVHGVARGATVLNYAIHGDATGFSPSSSVTAAGYFNGDLLYTGGLYFVSDQQFKDNIQPIVNASSLLEDFQTKTFEFKQSDYPSLGLPSGLQYGLIAQEVEQILPQMVKSFINPAVIDSSGQQIFPEIQYKAVNYEILIPVLVAGFKEQKHELDSLKLVVSNFIGQPRSTDNSNVNEKITLSDSKGIILNQNDPNPFSESTIIRFEIPESVNSARIMFTDMKGAVLKSAVIETRGKGSLEVFASDLSSGLYSYTLVCDGKVIDTKKMVKN